MVRSKSILRSTLSIARPPRTAASARLRVAIRTYAIPSFDPRTIVTRSSRVGNPIYALLEWDLHELPECRSPSAGGARRDGHPEATIVKVVRHFRNQNPVGSDVRHQLPTVPRGV